LIHFYKRIMKETPVSSCEKAFLLEGLWEGKRLDGRGTMEERNLEIIFGKDFGSCQVTLGQTRVQASVSSSVTEPRVSRPNEGILSIYVDLSPIAAPRFEVGRLTEEGVEINRTLERCLKESRCLDLESLCIVSEEKVWSIRLDVQVLNHCGNLADAASIAGLAALCQARRPDVTLRGEEITIHPVTERDPIPLAVHHHPVTTTFSMFQMAGQSDTLIVCDPSLLEEECSGGKMVIGVNAYREVCTLHLAGQVIIDKNLVLRLSHAAADKSKKIVEKIKQSLKEEEERRKKGIVRGYAGAMKSRSILQNSAEQKMFDLSKISREAKQNIEKTDPVEEVRCEVSKPMKGVIDIVPDTMESDDSSEASDLEITAEKTRDEIMKEKVTAHIELDEDSEEEETVMLTNV